jgi:hypothetical protein
VDRLTTGRRHVRAGSVTVTELLTRQASPPRCVDDTLVESPTEPDSDDDAEITDIIPVVVAAAHRREPAKGAQLAKLASLGVAGVVLCGAVTISSMVAHQRRENAQQAHRPLAQITGEQALLPDRLDETLPKAPEPAQDTPLSADERAQERQAQKAAPAPPPDRPATNSGDTTPSGGGATTGAVNDLELVREFYDNLPDSPGAAFNLLSADLGNASLGEFLASWSTVVAIDSVDVAQRADGVLATVKMRLLGGGNLRIQQLLTVAESPRRIVGVQLLSAQRN